jgi:putative alpha-1,2-mannosidase
VSGVFDNLGKLPGSLSVTNGRAGAFVQLGTGPGTVEFQVCRHNRQGTPQAHGRTTQVAVSFISVQQAQANLAAALAELPNFDAAHAAATQAWAGMTGRIAVLNATGASLDVQCMPKESA